MKKCFILLSLFGLLLLSACRSVPYSNRTQYLLTSESSEIALGNQAWDKIISSGDISTDKFYNERLRIVSTNLQKVVDKDNYNWNFVVIDSSQPNAFCLPGGKIVVYSGLFDILDNDGELASVVGHEIAHAIARHSGEQMTQNMTAQIGGTAASIALGQFVPVPVPWGTVIGTATQLGVALPYSRTHEYEADYIGLMIMAKAGYDPISAVTFWDKFQKQSNYNQLAEFLSTHPMGKKRLEDLKEDLPEANKLYKDSMQLGVGKVYIK